MTLPVPDARPWGEDNCHTEYLITDKCSKAERKWGKAGRSSDETKATTPAACIFLRTRAEVRARHRHCAACSEGATRVRNLMPSTIAMPSPPSSGLPSDATSQRVTSALVTPTPEACCPQSSDRASPSLVPERRGRAHPASDQGLSFWPWRYETPCMLPRQ